MKLGIKVGSPAAEKAALVAVGLFEAGAMPDATRLVDEAMGGAIARWVNDGDFEPKLGKTQILPATGKLAARRVLLIGLGKAEELTLDKLRKVAGKVATTVRDHGLKSYAAMLFGLGLEGIAAGDAAKSFAEGTLLGTYRYTAYRTQDKDKNKVLDAVTLLLPEAGLKEEVEEGVEMGTAIADAVYFTRDMVSAPPNELTPVRMAEASQEMASRTGLKATILDEKAIQKLGMGSFWGVAKGSAKEAPPRFIQLEYLPNGNTQAPVVFIGKAITFDSGGISIKPGEGMDKMKYDMAGGAAVIGAMQAIADLQLPVNVIGLVPATENMPSGGATHPGDILRAMNGMTIEIINTDAEGRLILADALCYASKFKPRAVVDLATLTGACVISLGHHAIALLGNDDALAERVRAAGERAGERAWRMPLWDEYAELIKSDIADVKNSGGRMGGTITAACFLKKFVKDYPWVHLDIAGTAWEDKGKPYTPKGATGVGVRLLVELAEDFASEEPAEQAPAPAPKAAAKKPAASAKAAPAAKATAVKAPAKAAPKKKA